MEGGNGLCGDEGEEATDEVNFLRGMESPCQGPCLQKDCRSSTSHGREASQESLA